LPVYVRQKMIVNYTESGWQVITQRSHGLLAAQICANWKFNEQYGSRWIETLTAVAEHDDVYNEFENDDLLNEYGGPVNFKMTVFRKDYCTRLIEMAITKSSWIALLVSRHIQFVHGSNPAAANFIKGLKKQEKDWISTRGVTSKEVSEAYLLLQFCDAFSLLICQGMIQPEQRKIEISKGPGQVSYMCVAGGINKLLVTPWPFEKEKFRVSFESRTLPRLTFKNAAEFRKELWSVETVVHQFSISAF